MVCKWRIIWEYVKWYNILILGENCIILNGDRGWEVEF